MLGDERVRTLRVLPAGVGGDGEARPYTGESSHFHFRGAGWGGLRSEQEGAADPGLAYVGVLLPEDKCEARHSLDFMVVEI